MPTFGKILQEVRDYQARRQREGKTDPVRRKYLKALHRLTGRNVVVYYSAFLHRQGPEHFLSTQINDEDKHGFMAVFAGLDFEKGLDIVLHSPGGDVAATESIIDYLRSKFGSNIRAIVPQISMSGGTMIAIAAREIVMGRHSNLGPIDPQIGGRPAIAILKEFERAERDITADPNKALLWQPILAKYQPTLLSHAYQSIQWAQEIGQKAVREAMYLDEPDAEQRAESIVNFLISHDLHRAHGRHLHRNELRTAGLKIVDLEEDSKLQDAVLSVHHACMLTVGNHPVNKLIENQNGIAHAKVLGGAPQVVPFEQLVQVPIKPVPTPPPSPDGVLLEPPEDPR